MVIAPIVREFESDRRYVVELRASYLFTRTYLVGRSCAPQGFKHPDPPTFGTFQDALDLVSNYLES